MTRPVAGSQGRGSTGLSALPLGEDSPPRHALLTQDAGQEWVPEALGAVGSRPPSPAVRAQSRPHPGRCPWYSAPSRASTQAWDSPPARPVEPPSAGGTRPPPLPRPRAGRTRPPRGSAGPGRPDADPPAPPAPTRPAGPFPPPRRDARPRAAHWPAAPGAGATPTPSLTWLLVVVAYNDEVIGQPRHGRRRRAREAGARRRPRRRRPPGPGGLSIFPAAAVAAAATLQPCLTTEARSAPAPLPRRSSPSPTRRPRGRARGAHPHPPRAAGSRGGGEGSAPRIPATCGHRRSSRWFPFENWLLPSGSSPPPPPLFLLKLGVLPSAFSILSGFGKKKTGMGKGGPLESLLLPLTPQPPKMRFSRPQLEAWNLHRQGFCCTFPVYVV